MDGVATVLLSIIYRACQHSVGKIDVEFPGLKKKEKSTGFLNGPIIIINLNIKSKSNLANRLPLSSLTVLLPR